jgi:predicted AAA+ superfamily ATPase
MGHRLPEGTVVPRLAAQRVDRALRDTPVVLVTGPRQSGKTTLVRHLLGGNRRYITLDDATSQEAALSDPVGFVRGFGPCHH